MHAGEHLILTRSPQRSRHGLAECHSSCYCRAAAFLLQRFVPVPSTSRLKPDSVFLHLLQTSAQTLRETLNTGLDIIITYIALIFIMPDAFIGSDVLVIHPYSHEYGHNKVLGSLRDFCLVGPKVQYRNDTLVRCYGLCFVGRLAEQSLVLAVYTYQRRPQFLLLPSTLYFSS